MRPGARTPEELETLLEDAFVIRDRETLTELFEDDAVLLAGSAAEEARGEEIAHVAAGVWDGDFIYLAGPRRVLQTRDTGLVIAERALNVVRRGRDGRWRYAISLLDPQDTTERSTR